MRTSLLIAALLAAFTANAAEIDDIGVKLSMKINRNGEQIATPGIWTKFGQTASIQSDKIVKLVIEAKDETDNALLQFDIQVPQSGELKSVGKPRISTPFDKEASLQFSLADGTTYRISVTPTKQAMPVKTAPKAS